MNDNELHLSSFEWQDVEQQEPMVAMQVGPLACSCFLLPEDGATQEKSTLLSDTDISSASHLCQLTASELVIKEHFKKLLLQLQIYRMLELIASIVFLGVMTWVIRPFVIVVLVAIFWYLPPSYTMRSHTKLFFYPFTAFAVKCSLVGISDIPTSARTLFICSMVRVVILFLAPFMVLVLPPLAWKEFIMHKDAFKAFLGETVEGWTMPLFQLWVTFAVIICLAALVWVALTFLMLRGRLWRTHYTPMYEEEDQSLLKKIEELTIQLKKACDLPPQDCRKQLESLKESGHDLKIVSRLSTLSGVAGVLGSLAGDFVNVITCFRAGSIMSGLFIGSYFVYEVKFVLDKAGPSQLHSEMKLSIERGIYTDNLWAFLNMTKGGHTAFSLIVQVCALPWSADGWISGTIAFGTIAYDLYTVTMYAYEQFDLGCDPSVRKEAISDNSPD